MLCKQLYERMRSELDPAYTYLIKPFPIKAAQQGVLSELVRVFAKTLQVINSLVDKNIVEKQRWWLPENAKS